jgi:cell division septum initiation protein DivIVA
MRHTSMQNYADENYDLKEKNAALQEENAALKKRVAELEGTVASEKPMTPDLLPALRILGHSTSAMATGEVAAALSVAEPKAKYFLEQLVTHKFARQSSVRGSIWFWSATPEGRAYLVSAGAL